MMGQNNYNFQFLKILLYSLKKKMIPNIDNFDLDFDGLIWEWVALDLDMHSDIE